MTVASKLYNSFRLPSFIVSHIFQKPTLQILHAIAFKLSAVEASFPSKRQGATAFREIYTLN
ncbi:hypothetical protein GCM10011273_34900 [Asticcacaulis endophyticus]|uniref:Uncharacterized protein n=1 Tax=Asticcacaulis endophyticus TaxID=1395890 RepID=A0A918UZG4_9CAUL|nr:hypothetical protein GCM10011273_34900 [Asticcacaulis endophyticus]